MRTPTHVRAAVIAAVLTALVACSSDTPISPVDESASGVSQPVVANAVSAATNQQPTAWISKPAHYSTWAKGAAVAFSGTGRDPEEGQLSGASLVWRSSIDGQIGTGRSFSLSSLSSGAHTITLTGTDSQGASFSHNRLITVTGPVVTNAAPVASISAPSDNASVVQGTSVSFAGSASDAESGALSGSALVWTSSLAGQIGTGTSFSTSALVVGVHTITLIARDPQAAADTVVRTLTVTAPVTATNQEPFGLISTPAHNASFAQGTSISFAGTSSDPEDGTLSGASLVWRSSIDGQIGTGTSFVKSNLSVGSHTITFTSTDSQGATFSHNRVISITATAAVNQAPTASISAPANGVSVTQGANVTFTGSGSDAESGALSGASLVWTSSRDGQIGTGTSFSKANLTVGTHTITLTARDPQNATGSATRTLTVNSTATASVNTAPVANFTANCVLLVCSFDASSSTDNAGVVQYAWNFGGGLVTRTTALISNTFLVAGTVNVSLTVSDAAGLTNTITKAVTMTSGSSTTSPSGMMFEPAGMSRLSESSFDCVSGCGGWAYWNESYAGGATMVPDPTAPRGGSGVVQENYTPSLTAGTSPGAFGATFAQKHTVYVAAWMKNSSNYQGHGSGVNKVFHFFTAGGKNIAIFNLRGSGTGALKPEILLQNIGLPLTYRSFGSSYTYTSTEQNLTSDPAVCTATRGVWHRYEMVLTSNTPGTANGRAELWMDGVKCVDVPNIGYFAAGDTNAWKDIWWSPTWGGTGGSPTTTFYEAMDHIYVSGK